VCSVFLYISIIPFPPFIPVWLYGYIIACYQYLYKKTCEFAEKNSFDGVVVPSKDEQILGQCTNRGGDFPGLIKASRLKDKKDNLIIVDFNKKYTLGGEYSYEDGALI